MQPTRKLQRALLVSVLMVASFAAGTHGAGAAGVTTHRWMAETALGKVTDASLLALLEQNLTMVQTGSGFPDVGYLPGNTYGETAHWQRFHDQLVDAILARTDCGDLTDPDGVCAPLIAFTLGVAAHGMGDEVWDWLFEPNGPDRDEYWTGVPTANDGGAETQMDIVAIGLYGVGRPESGTVPDQDLVLQAFVDAGEPGVSASEFGLVSSIPLLWDVEKDWADEHLDDLMAAMPWMSANLKTAPGGVEFAATAIAGYWESLWGRLTGDQPDTRVSITYPAPGETGVPATGWDRASFQPGSDHGRGGARNRIAAALTSARPYTGSPSGIPVADQLPVDSMTITDTSTGEFVPLKSGYPRSVPYGSSGGEHMIDTQPAGNLEKCTWYEVEVSVHAPLWDARGEAVTPYTWQFQTECDAPPPTTVTPTTVPPTTTPSTTAPPTTVPSTPPPATTLPATTTTVPTATTTTTPDTTTTIPPSTTTRPGSTAPTSGTPVGLGPVATAAPSAHAGGSAPAAVAVTGRPDYTG